MASENHQRVGAKSNAHVGSEFELLARDYFASKGMGLARNFVVPLGVANKKKPHKFDLGSEEPPVLIECKSHRWTKQDYVPSAKLTVWNEAMYYFSIIPAWHRKILFVLRDFSAKRGITLAEYYGKNYLHLIPEDVEILEFDPESSSAKQIVLIRD